MSRLQDAFNDKMLAVRASQILVVGVAYSDIDDIRESPALDVIELLQQKAQRALS